MKTLENAGFIREQLEQKYKNTLKVYHFEELSDVKKINAVIIDSLREFTSQNKKIALYCNGEHTKMLMSDFMFELKNVKYIVDNNSNVSDSTGFSLIHDEELEKEEIDAVIISSFKYKDEIMEGLRKNHPTIKILNFYDKLAENGIKLLAGYYNYNHPYQRYKRINSLHQEIGKLDELEKTEQTYFLLITLYVHIKDFRSAINIAKELHELVNKRLYRDLIKDLEEIYETEKKAAGLIAESNVLLFCLDGFRGQDMTEAYMPKLTGILKETGFVFDNAYSFSTSTFESLVPVYSENDDLRTGYFNRNSVEETECRFAQVAEKQNRHICFITDMSHYIEGKNIRYSGVPQTVTEKIWSFILDAAEEDNGLYYIHEAYESHYSFPNPYTREELISEGTAILFDYLPNKGGRLRTNYEQQHLDALRYLDDVISPLLRPMKCRMLIYADHGSLVLKEGCGVEEIKEGHLTCGEEWVRIPYAVRSPEMGTGRSNQLISLMSLNEIAISLMNRQTYDIPKRDYIKCARSEIYNPNFRYIYKMLGKDKCLLAFEAFVFAEGYKLLIYSNGETELFLIPSEQKVNDRTLCQAFVEKIRDHVTVCAMDEIKVE